MADELPKPDEKQVRAFLDEIEDEQQRDDCHAICDLMKDVTGAEPAMWSRGMVGFGTYHYVYESGREGDWMVVGFAPRKGKTSLYLMDGFSDYDELLDELGEHTIGKSCLYVKTLDAVDRDVLRTLVAKSVESMQQKYECEL